MQSARHGENAIRTLRVLSRIEKTFLKKFGVRIFEHLRARVIQFTKRTLEMELLPASKSHRLSSTNSADDKERQALIANRIYAARTSPGSHKEEVNPDTTTARRVVVAGGGLLTLVLLIIILIREAAIWHRSFFSPKLVRINTYNEQVNRRIENFRQLNKVRMHACGNFTAVLKGHDSPQSNNWKKHSPKSKYMASFESHSAKSQLSPEDIEVLNKIAPNMEDIAYYETGKDFKEKSKTRQTPPERYICRAHHPTLKGVTVTIERIGRFLGRGGYDWSVVRDLPDVGGLENKMSEYRALEFVGGMAAPVLEDGTVLSYPPIHIHHAHVFPYGNETERASKIHGSMNDHHDLIFQSHGDFECNDEEGGFACLLHQLPDDGSAYVVRSSSGLSANFDLNDARAVGSPELEFWFEIALLHRDEAREVQDDPLWEEEQEPAQQVVPRTAGTANIPETRQTTQIGLNNPCFGRGPCTYYFPMDPHSNVMWYSYIHGANNSDLCSGVMSDFVLHTHQTLSDSAYLIKTNSEDSPSLLNALDNYKDDKQLPLILDCHRGGTSLEEAKNQLLSTISHHGGEIVCQATSPSLKQGPNGHKYDKRSQLECQPEPVPLDTDDVLVVLAFNQVRSDPGRSRTSEAFLNQNAFSDYYAGYQHSIFRFNLNYLDDTAYAPPSYFYYSSGDDMDISLFEADPDEAITSTCPSSIRYSMQFH